MNEIRERNSSQVLALSKKITKLKEDLSEANHDYQIQENIKERNQEIQQILTNSHAIIEEKASLIHHLNSNILKTTTANNKIAELK